VKRGADHIGSATGDAWPLTRGGAVIANQATGSGPRSRPPVHASSFLGELKCVGALQATNGYKHIGPLEHIN
jgi:hypothetical protein